MKASILLLAAAAGVALAQPTSLNERADSVCQSGNGNPLEPTPACCYTVPWTAEHYPHSVCMARKFIPVTQRYLVGDQPLLTCIEQTASSSKTTEEFKESCHKINAKAQPRCCPKALIAKNENENIGDDLLCSDPKTVE
ncbi:hypothetical protein ASPWEDRAFT_192439 [Aspergillus wentii DTO 134E9]|uniref:Hydrophobin n=1 Tax=Aspergillus wentii DTO 134E9 TaxID=1073089 RepID=A0A1L9RYX0_ASPWE|nr:uncharacterized protein ASPWEDRAFT_192439 [Aspergillus wentii DTO 134E9]OJJ40129.1 hypothetical protein ASPWEDRAFT_192439 [Aspergillus wentii DTO 134E9]